MAEMDLAPEVFTADYTGTPGKRVFYLQARGEGAHNTYLLEKDQVAVLAEKLREVLVLVDREDTVLTATPSRDPGLVLAEPIEPQWRVGTMGLTYDDARDRVVLFMQRADAEDQPQGEEGFDVRLSLRRDQARSFVLHALSVVGEGRPLCQLCGLPIDPEGHNCPASNGHRPPS